MLFRVGCVGHRSRYLSPRIDTRFGEQPLAGVAGHECLKQGLEPPGMFILMQANICVVLCCLAGHQLYKQIISGNSTRRYPEGIAKTLQYTVGIPSLLLLIFFLLDPDFSAFVLLPFSGAFRTLGVLVFNIAALLILSAHISLGKFWSGELETIPGHRLIESGLYGIVRHPLYSSYFVLTTGLFLMTANWLVAGSMLAYFVAVATRVPREEEMLLLRVEGYGDYVLRVGRFVPRWQAFLPTSTESPQL